MKINFDKNNVLIQKKNEDFLKQLEISNIYDDLRPISNEYSSLFNPFSAINIQDEKILQNIPYIFLRDGRATFAEFLLRLPNIFEKSDTKFIIHESLFDLLPENLSKRFIGWDCRMRPEFGSLNKDKLVLFGILNKDYLGSVDSLKQKIEKLIPKSFKGEVEIIMPIHRSPFSTEDIDNEFVFDVCHYLKTKFKNLKFNEISSLLKRESRREYLFLDLQHNNSFYADNFLSYFQASLGAEVLNWSKVKSNKAIQSHRVSIYHDIDLISPPKLTGKLYNKLKSLEHHSEIINEPIFHDIINQVIS